MTRTRWTPIGILTLVIAGAGIVAAARSSNDTVRFYGQWKAAFLYNGTWVNIVSVHDATGYSNFVILPEGRVPVGNGKFSAADGKWTTDAPAPNDSGTYQFIDNNTAACKNAIGQSLVWQRDNTPLPPLVGLPQGSSLPSGTNFARVKATQAVEVCRKLAQAWQVDAVLVCINVFGPNQDGTVNIVADPQAFTITFASPSKKNIVTYVSTMPAGSFVVKPDAHAPSIDYFPISPKAIDLTDAIASARQFGLKANVGQAQLYWGHHPDKPERLVWSLEAGGAYPWIVSGATGAILSPFVVLDDKEKDYNKLAAETAAAVAQMRASMAHHRGAQTGGGAWLEAGMPFWSADAHEGGASSSSADEEDTWDNEVGAQNAWEDGNSDAESRFDAGEPTVEDTASYGGGE